MKHLLTICAAVLICVTAVAQQRTPKRPVDRIVVGAPSGEIIAPEIYGQFAEHLGRCIYGGIWVGKESPIPNVDGYRSDVLQALQQLHIPVLRWPGGCFADNYHWQDGIGDPAQRPKMVNSNWGGTVEDNSFGTHEFLDLCELLGCEPYISGNIGSGSVEEMSKWIEYMTSDADTPMANLRRANGRDKPWKVRYFGLGNEAWGCGGQMTAEYYSDLCRRYGEYCRNYSGNRLLKVASGASDGDYHWTEVLMQRVAGRVGALSLHYYTVEDWNHKGSATEFDTERYLSTLSKAVAIDSVITCHEQTMDRYDKECRTGLFIDEWGTWFDVEKGTNPAHLYQQNTMRDAMVAALSLNIFHRHCRRVRMTNIAQAVNVLQAMILTRDDGAMVLTPTYYVFSMYAPHQGAAFVPLTIESECLVGAQRGKGAVDAVDATASIKEGKLHITIVNADPQNDRTVEVDLEQTGVTKFRSGSILTCPHLTDCNTFDNPDAIKTARFDKVSLSKQGKMSVEVPCKSIVMIEAE